MNGFVSKLYDIDSIAIPKELTELRVDESRVEHELRMLCLRYATETSAERAEREDVVFCCADAASYPDGRTILLYPQTPVATSEQACEAVLGKTVGESVQTMLGEKETTLTVEHILRRIPAALEDTLVEKLGIEGVETVAAYRAYLRDKMMQEQRTERIKDLNRYYLDLMEQNSTFVYDEAELEAWIAEQKREFAADFEAMEIDIDSAEAHDLLVGQQKQLWIAKALCEKYGIAIDTAAAEAEADQMAEMMELMGETVPAREVLIEMSLQNEYTNALFDYLERLSAQKLEEADGNG